MYLRYLLHVLHDLDTSERMSVQILRSFKCKFRKIKNALLMQRHNNLTIHNFQKLHVNGLEVMHSDIGRVTTGQVRIKGHLSAQFV